MASIWHNLGLQDRRNLLLALTIPIAAYTAISTLKSRASPSSKSTIIPSPRQALQLLSKQDPDDLPYPPNALPGARDVDTPYGNIRVYEWGPETGRKVLFLHGISTPSIALAGMANLMVERGCRVMLLDLFGRGYSDAPDPSIYRQDIALWSSQILLAITSSKIAWTGTDNRFSLIGYSMGGGISVNFVSFFPELVESLILIAPGGLLRSSRISRSSKLLYGNLLPDFLVRYFVGQRLKGSSTAPPGIGRKEDNSTQDSSTGPTEAAEAEVPGHPANAGDSTAAIFPDRPTLSIADAVAWQVDAHPGFLASFISSIKFAPISFQHERWRMVGQRCAARRASSGAEKMLGLDQNKVLIIFGAQDSVIIAEETGQDAAGALGEENVKILNLEGGHDVPVVNKEGCVDAVFEFWNDSPV